jgi:hypothetical protein
MLGQMTNTIVVPFMAFIGVVVGAVITQGFILYRETRIQKLARTYLAMRLAVILEAFAIDCSSLINKNNRSESGDDDEGPCGNLPSLGEYPTDANWIVLDSNLANRALSFRNDLAVSDETIEFRWNMENAVQSDACNDEAAKRGIQAWDLAVELRKKYDLPPYSPGYDVGESLKKYVADTKRKTETAVMMDEIPETQVVNP